MIARAVLRITGSATALVAMAKTQAARLVVTGQMIADLVILGLAIKIIVGAVSRRRQPESATECRSRRTG